MYADEVHPHRTHQYKNHTRDVVTEKLQRPVQRLTLRGEREHRVRVPEPRIYPAAVRSSKRTDDRPQKENKNRRLAREIVKQHDLCFAWHDENKTWDLKF